MGAREVTGTAELGRWFGENAPCWVCAVVNLEAKASSVLETSEVLVLVSPLSLNPGHTLVVPRQHVRDLYTLPEELAGAVLSAASRVARAAKQAFADDGITLRQHNDVAGGQEVFHFHLHVVPRFVGDAERFNAPPKLVRFEEQQAIAERLRATLASV
jgi:histidine triad (HIT) family protein